MKVLHLTKFFAPVAGGIETVVFELVQGARRRGLEVDVLCVGEEPRTRSERSADGVLITRAGSWGTLLSTSMAPALIWQVRNLPVQYDLIHVHMPDPMSALALWAARPRARVVVHWHSDVVRQRRALRFYEPLQRWLLGRADAIVATSEPYAGSSPWLKPWQAKTSVIPIGISDNRGAAQAATVERIQRRFGGRRIVFSLGRMSYYKGFEVLIEAAARLREDCVIVVGGGGELLEAHRAQVAARGLTDRIVFIGRIPADELASHFAAATVFCLTSTHRAEAYGVVLLEAMAMGKPVIATEVEGSAMSWINQHGVTGLNVPAWDSEALADAINRIGADTALAARCGTAARERYEKSLGAEAMVGSTVALYERLLTGGASTTRQSGDSTRVTAEHR
jgi:glycosyltransferase involved in cell wall biosynthesis